MNLHEAKVKVSAQILRASRVRAMLRWTGVSLPPAPAVNVQELAELEDALKAQEAVSDYLKQLDGHMQNQETKLRETLETRYREVYVQLAQTCENLTELTPEKILQAQNLLETLDGVALQLRYVGGKPELIGEGSDIYFKLRNHLRDGSLRLAVQEFMLLDTIAGAHLNGSVEYARTNTAHEALVWAPAIPDTLLYQALCVGPNLYRVPFALLQNEPWRTRESCVSLLEVDAATLETAVVLFKDGATIPLEEALLNAKALEEN